MTNDNLTDVTAQLVAEAKRLGLHEECKEVLRAVQYYFYLSQEGSSASELADQEMKLRLALSELLGRVNQIYRPGPG